MKTLFLVMAVMAMGCSPPERDDTLEYKHDTQNKVGDEQSKVEQAAPVTFNEVETVTATQVCGDTEKARESEYTSNLQTSGDPLEVVASPTYASRLNQPSFSLTYLTSVVFATGAGGESSS